MKKISMPNSVKNLGYIKPYSSTSNSIRYKTRPSNSIRYKTVRRSAVDWEDLKSYWKSEKRLHFSRWSTILSFLCFVTLLTTERRLIWWQFLAVDLFPTFLNTGNTNEIFQLSRKHDCFRLILKSSASMYESSGSHFFRTMTGILSGPGTFDEWKFVNDLFNHPESYGNIMLLQISSRRKNG